MQFRALGKTGLNVSAIGYGALKIGRNQPQATKGGDTNGRILLEVAETGQTYQN